MKKLSFLLCALLFIGMAHAQNVGIGTTTPLAKLHVIDSSVLFSASGDIPVTPGNTPISGAGRRLMWYPDKAAFRVGHVDGLQWDKVNIGNYSIGMGANVLANGIASTSIGNSTQAGGNYSVAMGNDAIASGQFSTAIGVEPLASGDHAIALGYQAYASGNQSISLGYGNASNISATSIGYGNAASGQYATALGKLNTASGSSSLAMGDSTTASGSSSTAMGFETEAVGAFSTTMGNSSTATGESSTAMGFSTIAGGNSSTATGAGTSASGFVSTAMGGSTIASGEYSTTLGAVTRAKAVGSLSIGMFNDATDNPDPATTSPTDRIFQIGNGSISATSNAVTVLRNGNTGIGTVSPNAVLQFANAIANRKIVLWENANNDHQFYGFGVNGSTLRYQTPSTGDNHIFYSGASTTASTELFRIKGNGNVGVGVDPAFRLDVGARMRIHSTPGFTAGLWLNDDINTTTPAFIGMKLNDEVGFFGQTGTPGWRFYINTATGNGWMQGALTQASDARLKKEISRIQNPLQKIIQLNGYNYHWKDENTDNSLQTGLLAQEVQKIFPNLVKEGKDGMLAVNYSGLIPVMIESIKEQQKQIDELKRLVEKSLK